MGGAWAHYAWGRFWGWDPKEVWALITLLVYLVPLHGRFAGWMNTFGLVAASVVCFMAVLMSWYGVNFVLRAGLHNYGFTEGGDPRIVMACTLALLAVVGAAWWRRVAVRDDDNESDALSSGPSCSCGVARNHTMIAEFSCKSIESHSS